MTKLDNGGNPNAEPSGGRPSLLPVVEPHTIAVVGVSETSRFAGPIRASLDSGAEFFFVHPKADSVFGHRTYPDLRALDRAIDVVYSAVSAEVTADVAEAAADIGARGLITIAGGFAEAGRDGVVLQERIVAAARRGHFPVVGPNGVGMINAKRELNLTMLPRFERRIGGFSVVAHSGAMLEAIGASAWRAGGVGLNLMFSAGNEPVTDLADYLDFLAGDATTRVIGLVLEKIRRPEPFFDAARRCLAAGKPIVALKLGRGERAQRMAASHTGTLTGDAWVYDIAFKQAGILHADDIDDMVDRVQFLEQLPKSRWTPVNGLAVITVSGGAAQLASAMADQENVGLPEAPRLVPLIEKSIPGGTIPNPLDITPYVLRQPGMWQTVNEQYVAAPEFDTFMFTSQLADWDQNAKASVDVFVEVASASPKAAIVAPLSGAGGDWLDDYRQRGIGVGNGMRGCFRGVSTMGAFMRLRPDLVVRPATDVPALRAPHSPTLSVPEGEMLPFSETMELLATHGIPTAPYALISPDDDTITPPFPGPYVVKLADVAHRTEHKAVRLGVVTENLAAAVTDLRTVADRDGLPDVIAIQPMLPGHGEAFLGIQGASELGPVVAFGIGGVFVELLKHIGGRMAPMTEADAADLIAEFDHTGLIDGFRGAPAWDRAALQEVLVAAGRLAAGGREWIDSIDINPMIITTSGPVAVDGLCLVRPASRRVRDPSLPCPGT